jgi:predicted RNA-binding protein with PUA-like domain
MPGYWLFKTEPDTFSWDDLGASPDRTTVWDGVRNYTARNFLRDEVKRGDHVLFYHSGAKPPAVVGTATVVRAGFPDPSQFDPASPYHDPRSSPETPRWFSVSVRRARPLPRPVTLPVLRETRSLAGMRLLARGNRLSVLPVTEREWRIILEMGGL